MHIDLVPIVGKYRGVTRYLNLRGVKHFDTKSPLCKAYNRYLDWLSKQDDSYHPAALEILRELRNRLLEHNVPCEIVCYSDSQQEIPPTGQFLGFDVLGEERASALEEGNIIDEIYSAKLNEFGLFKKIEDAKEFCMMWEALIDAQESPWEVEINPRPFGVWVYSE